MHGKYIREKRKANRGNYVDSKTELAQRIKEAGQELIDRAEQMVGDNELITGFSIHVYFDQPMESVPTIEWTTEVLTKNTVNRISKGE